MTPFGQTLVRTTTIPHTECGPATTAHNARLLRKAPIREVPFDPRAALAGSASGGTGVRLDGTPMARCRTSPTMGRCEEGSVGVSNPSVRAWNGHVRTFDMSRKSGPLVSVRNVTVNGNPCRWSRARHSAGTVVVEPWTRCSGW